MNHLKYLLTLTLIYSPLFCHAAEPIISINNDSNIINIDPHGSTASQILVALEKQMGFELSGKLEAEAIAINHPLQGNTQQLIEELAKPQSIMMLFSSDKNGNKIISKVELLPTGKTDSKFLNDGKTLVASPSISPIEARDARRQARQKQRDERHAQGLGRRNKKLEK